MDVSLLPNVLGWACLCSGAGYPPRRIKPNLGGVYINRAVSVLDGSDETSRPILYVFAADRRSSVLRVSLHLSLHAITADVFSAP